MWHWQWHTSCDNFHQAFSALFVTQATTAVEEDWERGFSSLFVMQAPTAVKEDWERGFSSLFVMQAPTAVKEDWERGFSSLFVMQATTAVKEDWERGLRRTENEASLPWTIAVVNVMTQLCDRSLHKKALLFLQAQSCFFKLTKDFVQWLQVFFCCRACH